MPTEFFPVNLDLRRHLQGRHLGLVRVTAGLQLDFSCFSWHQRKDRVWRFHQLTPTRTISLAQHALLLHRDLHPKFVAPFEGPIHFRNGDPLDCRFVNLLVNATAEDLANLPAPVEPGSTFRSTPQALATLVDVEANIDLYRKHSRNNHSPLSPRVQEALLDHIRSEYDRVPIRILRERLAVDRDMPANFPLPCLATLREMIAGKRLPLPGYDYEALHETRRQKGKPSAYSYI
jgi:hypothetical protein